MSNKIQEKIIAWLEENKEELPKTSAPPAPYRLSGYCMGCGRGEVAGLELTIGWLLKNGTYNQIHDSQECRALWEVKTRAEFRARLEGWQE